MLTNKPISSAKVNELFNEISLKYGYDPSEYTHELATLIDIWETQGFVEIYQTIEDREYGRIKASENDGDGHFIYQYCDLYHARVSSNGHDPLVIVTFHPEDDSSDDEYVSLRFLSDHEQLFGTTHQKQRRDQLKVIRDKADDFIQQSNPAKDK